MDDFVRVGGLAAISAALPRALRSWSDVRILLPGYSDVVEQLTHIEIVGQSPSFGEMPACTLGRAATKDGLPVLSKIPVVGGLFGSQDTTHKRTELLVLLTPRVIRNPDDAKAITEELMRKIKTLQPTAVPKAKTP